jgi:hypothetical protein
LENDFERLAYILLQTRTHTFMYRDFQSRNVMVVGEEPYFIDFQGGRRGPLHYDLASFLWQAKAHFNPELRNELIELYLSTSLCSGYPALKTYDTIRYIMVEDDVVRLRHDTIVAYDTCHQVGVEVAVGRPPFTFHWMPETDIDFPYQQYSTATITESRTYQVAVADTRGHTDTADIYVEVRPRTNGIESAPEEEFDLYPNPTSGEVIVTMEDEVQGIILYNTQGQPVGGWKILSLAGNRATLDVSALPAGPYLVRIATPRGTVTKKLVVRRR